ncbi:MAG TPA: aldo/keto reductase [Phycisphaerae bacterium]|nr:aldo/keto reductase [Phycisphaerae bacterium]
MKYRAFGRLDFQVSALGFGCMRLPTTGPSGEVDEPAAIEMIRYAIDHGVNYVDTAYPYHGGASERVLGKALAGGYRERVALATKMPVWMVNCPADFDRLFDEQCARLGADRIDYYLLHNLQAPSWPRMRDLGATAWLEKTQAAGRIGHVGFSFHDTFDVLRDIVEAYDGWSFCQVQYNFVNEDVQAGTAGVEYAAGRGLAVVVMEPLFGGTLAAPPPPVRRLWDEALGRPDPVDLALRWLWDKPEVSVVLSGMTALEHVRRNVASAERSGPGTLTAAERDLLARVRDAYQALDPVPCTGCGYCLPCPSGVAVPDNFQLYNNVQVFKGSTVGLNRNLYHDMPAAKRADRCTACRECEAQCPQGIAVSQWMPKVHDELSKR